ncbi:methylmalonyl-CoA mutase [Rhodobacteraceae bacterium RKSG542]|uniref:methylmalonyl-CoA mutase family protein n=1 Tax=Pseudovibrio flavus TaxID=2529854 RepID=UPI0012BBEFBE|nr:methylmalonyl-CoA mutase family protein [Pseudovibrio flavus]MTI18923.1 methylmalonyl-CoA mutase [Pseudovibrio flavus]
MEHQSIDIPSYFREASRNDWEGAAAKALKGAAVSTLDTTDRDGLTVSAIYEGMRERNPLQLRGARVPWRIVQRVDHPIIEQANDQILEDLMGGADSLELVFPSSSNSRGSGVDARSLEDMLKLLDGVKPDLIDFHLDCGYEGSAVTMLLLEACKSMGIAEDSLRIHAPVEIWGIYAQNGVIRNPLDVLGTRLIDFAAHMKQMGVHGSLCRADGRIFHNAGASPAQELGIILASTIAYLRMLENGNLSDEDLARMVGVTAVADADQFTTLAKARALRVLWSRLMNVAGLPAEGLHLHMESSWRMQTRYDPWVNMLRSSVSAFAAGLGGADSVTVLPFMVAGGLADGFSRRVARNTQSILIEESNLAAVNDPGAGSGLVEQRTDAIAREAWRFFQQIEADGGIFNALQSGFLQSAIAKKRAEQEEAVAFGAMPLTGTTAFPNADEKPVRINVVDLPDICVSTKVEGIAEPDAQGSHCASFRKFYAEGFTLLDIQSSRPKTNGITCEKLPIARLSEPFEALRKQAENFTELTGVAPKIFMATIGSVADHTARATFAANLYASGGFQATPSAVFSDTAAMVKAFKESGAVIACLCGTDDAYAERGAELVAQLKSAGAERVTVVVKPKGLPDSADAVVFNGCNILAELQSCHAVFSHPPHSDLRLSLEEGA